MAPTHCGHQNTLSDRRDSGRHRGGPPTAPLLTTPLLQKGVQCGAVGETEGGAKAAGSKVQWLQNCLT